MSYSLLARVFSASPPAFVQFLSFNMNILSQYYYYAYLAGLFGQPKLFILIYSPARPSVDVQYSQAVL